MRLMDYAQIIEFICKNLDMTRKALSTELDVCGRTLRNYVSGSTKVPIHIDNELCNLLWSAVQTESGSKKLFLNLLHSKPVCEAVNTILDVLERYINLQETLNKSRNDVTLDLDLLEVSTEPHNNPISSSESDIFELLCDLSANPTESEKSDTNHKPNEIDRSNFSANLRYLRTIAGLTRVQLGKAVGISESTLTRYEHGEGEPDIHHGYLIAQKLGVTLDQLVNPHTSLNSDYRKHQQNETAYLQSLNYSINDESIKSFLLHAKTICSTYNIPQDMKIKLLFEFLKIYVTNM